MRNSYKFTVVRSKEKRPLGRPESRRKHSIKIYMETYILLGCGVELSGSGKRPVPGFYGHGNESSVSIKGGEFLE
jgi:hypothetical protein